MRLLILEWPTSTSKERPQRARIEWLIRSIKHWQGIRNSKSTKYIKYITAYVEMLWAELALCYFATLSYRIKETIHRGNSNGLFPTKCTQIPVQYLQQPSAIDNGQLAACVCTRAINHSVCFQCHIVCFEYRSEYRIAHIRANGTHWFPSEIVRL